MQSAQSTIDKIIAVTNSTEKASEEKIRAQLVSLINELINEDFQALIQLLYRIDVSEKNIRINLEKNSDIDSATVLADLIIERQLQKIDSRKKFNSNNSDENDEEKW
jgi:hypothetical protein